MRANTKSQGDVAELKFAAYFASKGYFVSKPLTDNAPYDLIVDTGEQLLKVQVKSRTEVDGKIAVQLFTSMVNYKYMYTEKDFDIIGVYHQDTGRMALVKWDDFKNCGQLFLLRMNAPKNNQTKNIRLFTDYEVKF